MKKSVLTALALAGLFTTDVWAKGVKTPSVTNRSDTPILKTPIKGFTIPSTTVNNFPAGITRGSLDLGGVVYKNYIFSPGSTFIITKGKLADLAVVTHGSKCIEGILEKGKVNNAEIFKDKPGYLCVRGNLGKVRYYFTPK